MPLPLLIAGLGTSLAGSIVGGITGAANAKGQAMAANMQNNWSNFEQQWKNSQANFSLAQQQRFDRERREGVRRVSLSNALAQQHEIYRQSSIQASVLSDQYMSAVGSANASIETRGLVGSGTERMIRNQMDQMVLRDAAAMRRNRAIGIGNVTAQRNQTISDLGPQIMQLPSTYINSTPYAVPSTTGAMIGSMLQGLGSFSSGLSAGLDKG